MNTLSTTQPIHPPAPDFGLLLPRALRDSHLSWDAFTSRYTCTSGPIRFGTWATRAQRGGRTEFDATFAFGDTITSCSATAFGAVEALTSMLYDAGFHVEIISFHQQNAGGQTMTFVECDSGGRREWAMAHDSDSIESSIRAIIGAANMLHS